MKKLKITLVICLFLSSINLIAQDSIQVPRVIDRSSFGLGLGMDFGGVGANMLVYPNKNIGLFGGVGYAIGGIGYNAGVKIRIISKKHDADPYALIMYGYNAAVKVSGASQYDKLFYGPSLGVGMDLHLNRKNKGYWSMALIVPIRKPEVNEYIDDLKTNHGVEFKNGLLPVAFSIGYRFILR